MSRSDGHISSNRSEKTTYTVHMYDTTPKTVVHKTFFGIRQHNNEHGVLSTLLCKLVIWHLQLPPCCRA